MDYLPAVLAVVAIAAVGVFIAYILKVLDAEERAYSDAVLKAPAPRPEPGRELAGKP